MKNNSSDGLCSSGFGESVLRGRRLTSLGAGRYNSNQLSPSYATQSLVFALSPQIRVLNHQDQREESESVYLVPRMVFSVLEY